jgi:hypothetical protein
LVFICVLYSNNTAASPSDFTLSLQWLSPTAAALVEVLLIARVASLSALREQWKQQPRWLLPQILPWYVASNRAPRCCFSLKSILFRLETVVPTKKIVSNAALRYSKAHRDAIKRVWPPSLDARAPVQVIFTV